MTVLERCMQGDEYMQARTGKYEYREVRYLLAAGALRGLSLNNDHTVLDIGAGWTEFDYCLRRTLDWRGRYIPIDAGIDGTDLECWIPPRTYEFAVGLEILEHLEMPHVLVAKLQAYVTKAIVVSVPNPRTVDVLGIDPTHKTVITWNMLQDWGFYCEETTLYGGVWSNGEPDSIFGVWVP